MRQESVSVISNGKIGKVISGVVVENDYHLCGSYENKKCHAQRVDLDQELKDCNPGECTKFFIDLNLLPSGTVKRIKDLVVF